MNYNWNNMAKLSAIGLYCSLAVWINSSSGGTSQTSVLVNKPLVIDPDSPALPPPANPKAEVATPLQQPAKPAAKRPFLQPATPRASASGMLTTQIEPMPVPERPLATPPTAGPAAPNTGPVVHPAPPIDYDTHRGARRMYRSGQIQMVVVAQDPADGCCYEIPLCIPACCTDAPKVSSGRGIFGRGVVEYCWSCGFRAKVKFRHILGDVKVEYQGD